MIHIGEVYKIGEFRGLYFGNVNLKKSPRGDVRDQIMAGRKTGPSADLSRVLTVLRKLLQTFS